MSKKLLFMVISVIYLILIAFGLTMVYSVGTTSALKKPTTAANENKISIAHTEIFGKLQRPQVLFDHKKHEEAYKKEGCGACHPMKDKNQVIFKFPKETIGKGKKAVMKAYHDECIECHKKAGAANKKTGPVTCNDCHKKEFAGIKVKLPRVEFDFANHDKHVKIMKEKFGKDDCGQCHHTYDLNEKKVTYRKGTEESCLYCHDLDKKRGPEFAAITKVAAEKGLSLRAVSHQQCLNCHLAYKGQYMSIDKKDVHNIHQEKLLCNACHTVDFKHAISCTDCHIPLDCSKCHTGKYKTIDELKNASRPDRGQKNVAFIDIENSRMKGVPFDHKSHQNNTVSCRSCHHEGLKACKDCHSLTGKPEGNGVNIANAYHRVFAGQSCSGCHKKQKEQKECSGCHYFIADMNPDTMNPKSNTCSSCHTGRKDQLAMPKPISTAGVGIKGNIEISTLAKEYEPSVFPHLDVINKLVRVSNDSRLATYFHRDIQTLCNGCHHQSNSAAELQKPNCRNCHMVSEGMQNPGKIRLLAAYHGQCLGCHAKMDIDSGKKCEDCHKKNERGTSEITQIKNTNVVKQNTSKILNMWRPR